MDGGEVFQFMRESRQDVPFSESNAAGPAVIGKRSALDWKRELYTITPTRS